MSISGIGQIPAIVISANTVTDYYIDKHSISYKIYCASCLNYYLLDTDTACSPAAGAGFKAGFISPGGRCFGIGTEGQFPAYPARPLTEWTSGYYFHYRLPTHRFGLIIYPIPKGYQKCGSLLF